MIITDNSNDLNAKFFVRLSSKKNISAVDGSGTVSPKTTSTINWTIIPAPGSAGVSPLGKKYLVGATLTYKFGGETTVLEVSPDVINVKPLPLLTLDYFLPQYVLGDDPLTLITEKVEPFTLGVRVKNNGHATAKNLKIDSAQPKIVENNQGLNINFSLTGSFVNDSQVQNSLLINFGDILSGTSKMGRWIMESTLAGKFTEFTAKFSHSDELGGALTSILQATNAHFLIKDVRVDLQGRDYVKDFLAQDGDVIRVYESDGPDSEVLDRSSVATLVANSESNNNYKLNFPTTAGFVYVKLPDPFSGSKLVSKLVRSDAKNLTSENVWLSKTRNEQTKEWSYWVNFFDVNTTGDYTAEFQIAPTPELPPTIQFIPNRVVKEGKQVSFIVEATSQNNKALTLTASTLPAGATFTQQVISASTPSMRNAIFDWTPAKGAAGNYLITYSVTDGQLSSSKSASIKVEPDDTLPVGPGVPTIDAPLSGAQVDTLLPTISVMPSSNNSDPTIKVQFEVYKDEAATQLIASKVVDKVKSVEGAIRLPTSFKLVEDLEDNTRYWWRARAFDGALYSSWVSGHFFVNLFNDPPDSFNLTSPALGSEISTNAPMLSWTNSKDKDHDIIKYSVFVYEDMALSKVVTQVTDVIELNTGSTSWEITTPLTNHVKYYWRVLAKDANGAQTFSSTRSFIVNTGNTSPTPPVIVSPAVGGQSTNNSIELIVENSSDAENDLITYVFEIDTSNTFDSSDKRSSGQLIQTSSTNMSWAVTGLIENKRYWWRVKAQDGRAQSNWVIGDFLMNALNEAPPSPTIKNPGNEAWSATQQPNLEANPVVDPEGELVFYEFEVYKNQDLTEKLIEGTSSTTAFLLPSALSDKTTYWWRVRASDVKNEASAWSKPAKLYVSTAPFQNPTISVTSPSIPIIPDTVSTANGVRKQVTITWEGTDPNIEPTIALYYSTTKSGFTGNLIIDGLRQNAGLHSGSYTWDVTNLAPGAYYIYAVIYDAKGVGKGYAPGAVVVPNIKQTGGIVVTAGKNLTTSEDGTDAIFKIRLAKAPTANVILPLSTSNSREGVTNPLNLTFTKTNWAVNQTVSVIGQNDCVPDGRKVFQVNSGKAISIDPNYIGLSGSPVNVTNLESYDFQSSTNNPNLHICGLVLLKERKTDDSTWEYHVTAELRNTGVLVNGVIARLEELPITVKLRDAVLHFGSVNEGETAKTKDYFVLRSKFPIPKKFFKLGVAIRWNVAVQP